MHNLHYEKFQDGTVKCIEDEIPFEVPEGWEWSRIGSVFNTVTGSTPSTKIKEYYGDDYPFYKPTDLDNGYNVNNSTDHVSEVGFRAGRPLAENSVLVTCIGATIGKTGLIHTSGICNQQINAILPSDNMNSGFTFFCMCSEYEQNQIISNASATTLPILNKSRFDMLLFIVPPIQQQNKITNEINRLLELVSALEENKESLQETISNTKIKILDLAIRGKLVPQNQNDEPASVLLERIRTEKEELTKQGKLRKDKKESIIYKGDDNSYYMTGKKEPLENAFALPDGWIWASLPEIVFFQEGPGIMKKDFRDSGVPLIRISGLQTDKVSLDGCNYLDPEMVENKWKHFKLELGDIVVCTSASIGKVSIVDSETVGSIPYTGQIRFQMSPAIIKDYFLYFAMSNVYLNQINMLKTGNCIQHYGPTHLKQVIVPLPPIAEQKRISNAVKQYIMHLELIFDQVN